jgi:RNA polymerase sigma factor (sigma-70 family)
MNLDSTEFLKPLINGCQKGDATSQKVIYKGFYGYGMNICLRYSSNREEANEILNDGFMKVFTKIETYDKAKPFKLWLRRIMINTAINYYKKNLRHNNTLELVYADNETFQPEIIEQITANEILEIIQKLPPAYRTVFNLYAIEGYKHHEIAELLSIEIGTSKSNLAKARLKIKSMINNTNKELFRKHEG